LSAQLIILTNPVCNRT